MENKKKWAGWGIAAVVLVLLAVAFAVASATMESPENGQAAIEGLEELSALFPEADQGSAGFETMGVSNTEGIVFAYTVKKGGQAVGYAARSTVKGYAGPIEVTVGVEPSGTVRGIVVGGAEFNETEGLGSLVRDDAFRSQFTGVQPPVALGDQIDAVSGATVSSQAVVDGVNNAVQSLQSGIGGGGATPEVTQNPGQSAAASVLGYAGPVLVTVTMDDLGAITALEVGKARFSETEGLGSLVKEEAFTGQFIGKKPPLSIEDIDAVSGATVSSNAVVEAVNAAFQFMGGK